MIQEFDGDIKMKTKEECESYVLEHERKKYWIPVPVSRDSEEIEKAALMISLNINH